ncbi:MAG: hypothetical protein CVU56_27845 [Deltaproteobacteria bacterium HGW-Deltaproteobacteria-14]|jgi:hypothetical protein|nr:MAG: hypothetical protein CVU56_27845 [Deltaproteobacteria bacterium HGW-Deltaproteobacteria-14]
MPNSLANIEAFLRQKRIALVGASHDPKDFSRVVMRELLELGYDVVPVNPKAGTIEGRASYPRLTDLPEPVGGALVMVPAAASEAVVRDAAAARVPRVWLHRGGGPGSSTPEAVRAAHDLDLALVDGECPLMFVGRARVHRIHGAMRRLNERYPRAAPAPRVPWPAVAALALLQIVVGLGAVVSAALMLVDPTGSTLGLDVAQLTSSPFGSFLLPALVLLVVIGVGHLTGLALTATRRAGAPRAAILLGALLMVWILAQLLWLRDTSALQTISFVIGASEVALGLLVHRLRWPRPTFVVRVSPTST